MARCKNCGHTEKMCKCSGGRMSKSANFKKEYMDAYRYSNGRTGSKKNVTDALVDMDDAYLNYPLDPIINDQYSARDALREKSNSQNYNWLRAAPLMGRSGGMVYMMGDNNKDGIVQNDLNHYTDPSMAIRGYQYPEYNRGLPAGLVSGRTFWGLPGGRSGRGVGTSKSMKKGISLVDQLRGMINGMRGIGEIKGNSPAALAAALLATGKGGSSGMKDYPAPGMSRASASAASAASQRPQDARRAEAYRATSAGPRSQDYRRSAIMNAKVIRDPENPNFVPTRQNPKVAELIHAILRDGIQSGRGISTSKRMSKASIVPKPPIPPRRIFPTDPLAGAPDYVRYTVNARSGRPSMQQMRDAIQMFRNRKQRPNMDMLPTENPFKRKQYDPAGSISGGSRGGGAFKSMSKSISSISQNGTRHVVGGYRGGSISKAIAASQTQRKNKFI